MSDRKLQVFISHPIQYFAPLYRKLAETLELTVYYYSDYNINKGIDKDFGVKVNWGIDLLNGYRYRFLKNWSPIRLMKNGFFDAINPGVLIPLFREKKSVVLISSWKSVSDLMVIIFSRILGHRVWLRCDNPLSHELQLSPYKRKIKSFFLKPLFYYFIDKGLYVGEQNKLFYQYYGLPIENLLFSPHAVDNQFFKEWHQRNKDSVNKIKSEIKVPEDRFVILFVGKFIRKKRPFDLLKAFTQCNFNKHLIMVGEGHLKPEIEKYILEHRLSDCVTLTGFANQTEITKYYSITDVLVLCSGVGETWGLCINEGMNFELPVIVSASCGCTQDLVKENENGFVIAEGDIESLREKLTYMYLHPEFRSNAGLVSKKLISEYSYEKISLNIKNTI